MIHEHRIIQNRYSLPDGSWGNLYSICEVYYDKHGKIFAGSKEADGIMGETLAELQKNYEDFELAFKKPIIMSEDIPSNVK